jgi:hypothetical protein
VLVADDQDVAERARRASRNRLPARSSRNAPVTISAVTANPISASPSTTSAARLAAG